MKSLLTFSLLLFTVSLQAQMTADHLPSLPSPSVYNPPVYPGGETELLNFIATKLEYPELAQEYSVEGMVVARLQLKPNGEVLNSSIVKSLGYGCDEAVLAVIEQMPAWEPARYDDEAEYGIVYLPVRFSLR